MLTNILMVLIIAFAVYLILKKYQPHTVLLLTGMMLIALAIVANPGVDIFPKGYKTTGSKMLDIIEIFRALASARFASLGIIIMAAGGFSKYMDHIGAADAMVKIATKPLGKIKNIYVILGMTYIIGQIINVFVPSAAGLAMLLLVAVYPILINLGAKPIAAVSVIATTACLDLGPASGASNAAAGWIGITPVEYFLNHQFLLAVISIPVIAILHMVVQYYFDKKEKETEFIGVKSVEKELKNAPAVYAILPLLPLILLMVFSKFVISSINMHVVTAMLLSTLIAMVFELVRTKDTMKISKDLMVFFKGMGELFADVVSLVICGEIFATGFMALGGVDALIKLGQGSGAGAFFMMLLLVALIIFASILTGSGNAPFFSFGKLAPDIAAKFGVESVAYVLPMQLISGMSRSISPISGVIIICAGATKVSPFAIVKRTAIPMAGGMAVVVLGGWFL